MEFDIIFTENTPVIQEEKLRIVNNFKTFYRSLRLKFSNSDISKAMTDLTKNTAIEYSAVFSSIQVIIEDDDNFFTLNFTSNSLGQTIASRDQLAANTKFDNTNSVLATGVTVQDVIEQLDNKLTRTDSQVFKTISEVTLIATNRILIKGGIYETADETIVVEDIVIDPIGLVLIPTPINTIVFIGGGLNYNGTYSFSIVPVNGVTLTYSGVISGAGSSLAAAQMVRTQIVNYTPFINGGYEFSEQVNGEISVTGPAPFHVIFNAISSDMYDYTSSIAYGAMGARHPDSDLEFNRLKPLTNYYPFLIKNLSDNKYGWVISDLKSNIPQMEGIEIIQSFAEIFPFTTNGQGNITEFNNPVMLTDKNYKDIISLHDLSLPVVYNAVDYTGTPPENPVDGEVYVVRGPNKTGAFTNISDNTTVVYSNITEQWTTLPYPEGYKSVIVFLAYSTSGIKVLLRDKFAQDFIPLRAALAEDYIEIGSADVVNGNPPGKKFAKETILKADIPSGMNIVLRTGPTGELPEDGFYRVSNYSDNIITLSSIESNAAIVDPGGWVLIYSARNASSWITITQSTP